MAEYDVSQIPVIQAEPPLAAAEVVGAVHERDLMQRAVHDPRDPRPLGGRGHGPAACPRWEAARRWTSPCVRLEESPAVIVLDNGHPVGVITRSDALAFLAQAGSAREGR